MSRIRYKILNPTGNITALAESPVPVPDQPAAGAVIMRRHPEVEQVGFVRFPENPEEGGVQAELRMAGGEFCGNASMCTAALVLLRNGERGTVPASETVVLRVSGAAHPVEVRLQRTAADEFRAGVHMPDALEIGERVFSFGGAEGKLPLVRMPGISHLIVEMDSVFFSLRENRPAAEQAVREWCDALGTECLGLMFLEHDTPGNRLTPLVCVPGSGTVFWENSCASGSSAAGMVLAARSGVPVDLAFSAPGGTMHVRSGADGIWLFGQVKQRGEYQI